MESLIIHTWTGQDCETKAARGFFAALRMTVPWTVILSAAKNPRAALVITRRGACYEHITRSCLQTQCGSTLCVVSVPGPDIIEPEQGPCHPCSGQRLRACQPGRLSQKRYQTGYPAGERPRKRRDFQRSEHLEW